MPSALMKKRSRLASLAAAAQASAARRPDVAIEASQQWVVRSSPTATARLVIAIRATGGLTGYGETTAGSVKGGVNLDHFGGAKVDQLVKG